MFGDEKSSSCALVLALSLITFSDVGAQNEDEARGPVENGRSAYLRVGCDACHGTVGHGGAAAPLAPNVLPMQAFESWVRNGTPGWTNVRGMPAFSESLITDEDLANIREYLISLPLPPPVEDIPLLELD